jgi:hypothetical protein
LKKILAILVVLLAAIPMSAMATTTLLPDWLEAIKVPGTSYTTGDYSTEKGVVQDSFDPITITSGLTLASDDVNADISQTATTSITGKSIGIDRQYVKQTGSYFAASSTGLIYDAETPGIAQPLVLGLTKDQTAAFSGRIITGDLIKGYDKNGDMIADDPYGGEHQLLWYDNPSFSGTFSDTGMVSADDASGNTVALKESLGTARATVSTGDDIFQIDPASACMGKGEYWQGYATIDPVTNLYPLPYGDDTQEKVAGPLSAYQGALTEVSTSVSSDVTLKQTQVGDVTSTNGLTSATLIDGSASLSADFASAILGGNNKVSVDLNSGVMPFKFWWENIP